MPGSMKCRASRHCQEPARRRSHLQGRSDRQPQRSWALLPASPHRVVADADVATARQAASAVGGGSRPLAGCAFAASDREKQQSNFGIEVSELELCSFLDRR